MDIEELKRLALAATPGPWIVQTGCSWRRIGTPGGDGDVLRPVKNQHDGWPDLAGPMANLEFIAAANPQAVLALTAQIETLQVLNTRALEYFEARDEKMGGANPGTPFGKLLADLRAARQQQG